MRNFNLKSTASLIASTSLKASATLVEKIEWQFFSNGKIYASRKLILMFFFQRTYWSDSKLYLFLFLYGKFRSISFVSRVHHFLFKVFNMRFASLFTIWLNSNEKNSHELLELSLFYCQLNKNKPNIVNNKMYFSEFVELLRLYGSNG